MEFFSILTEMLSLLLNLFRKLIIIYIFLFHNHFIFSFISFFLSYHICHFLFLSFFFFYLSYLPPSSQNGMDVNKAHLFIIHNFFIKKTLSRWYIFFYSLFRCYLIRLCTHSIMVCKQLTGNRKAREWNVMHLKKSNAVDRSQSSGVIWLDFHH